MKFKALIFLLLSCTIHIWAAGEVVSYESGICRFNLHGYKMRPHIERAIVFGVSRIIDTYRDTFGFSFPEDFKVNVTLIAGRKEFLSYFKKQTGSNDTKLTGYYSFQQNEAVVWVQNDKHKTIGTLFHETSHLLLAHHIPWCPKWVNEGLAEYFEGLKVIGEKKRVFLQEQRSKWCQYWLKKGFPIKLDEYLRLNHDEWWKLYEKDANAAYTIGYSLIYFLMSSGRTEYVLKEILWDFKIRGPKANSIEVINANYPGGYAKLEKRWLKWIPKARPYRPLRALRKHAEKELREKQRNNSSN